MEQLDPFTVVFMFINFVIALLLLLQIHVLSDEHRFRCSSYAKGEHDSLLAYNCDVQGIKMIKHPIVPTVVKIVSLHLLMDVKLPKLLPSCICKDDD